MADPRLESSEDILSFLNEGGLPSSVGLSSEDNEILRFLGDDTDSAETLTSQDTDVRSFRGSGAGGSFDDPFGPRTEAATEANAPLSFGRTAAPVLESETTAAIRGATRGITETAGFLALLGDPVGELVRISYGSGTTDQLFDLAEKFGIKPRQIQAQRGGARLAEKLAEETTAALIPAGALFRAARLASPALMGKRFIGAFVRFAKERPKAFIASEVAAAEGAGIGRNIAGETTGQQIGGAVAGSITPAVITTVPRHLIVNPIRALKRTGILGKATKIESGAILSAAETGSELPVRVRRVVRKAKQELDELAGGDTGVVARKIQDVLDESIEGLNPTTVQAARGEPGFKAFELRRTAGESDIAVSLNKRLTQRRRESQEAVVEELGELAELNRVETGDAGALGKAIEIEPPTATPKEIVDAKISARAEQAAASFDELIEGSQQRVGRRIEELTSGEQSTDAAVALRQALEEEEQIVFKPIREGYDELDETARLAGAELDAGILVSARGKIRRTSTQAEGTGLPQRISETLRKMTAPVVAGDGKTLLPPAPIPFEELRGLRRQLNREIRVLRRNPDARFSVKRLVEVKEAVDQTLDLSDDAARARVHGVPPETADRLVSESRALDAQFGAASERFRKGVSGQILEPQKGPPAASATASLYFRPGRGRGQLESAENFNAAARNSGIMRQSMEDYIISLAWETVNHPEKGPTSVALRRFTAKYDEALREFPEVRKKLSNVESLLDAAENQGLSKQAFQANFDKSVAGMWLKGDPRSAVAKVLNSSNPRRAIRVLLADVGDEEGRRAVGRVFWSELRRRAVRYGDLGTGTSLYVEPNNFNRLIDDNADVIEEIYGTSHLKRLKSLASDAEVAFQGKIPDTARAQQRSQLDRFNAAPKGWLYNRIYSLKTRLFRGALLGLKWVAKLDRGHIEALLDEVLLDPKLLIAIDKIALTPQAQKVAIRRMRSVLLSLGYRVPPIEGDKTQEENK